MHRFLTHPLVTEPCERPLPGSASARRNDRKGRKAVLPASMWKLSHRFGVGGPGRCSERSLPITLIAACPDARAMPPRRADRPAAPAAVSRRRPRRRRSLTGGRVVVRGHRRRTAARSRRCASRDPRTPRHHGAELGRPCRAEQPAWCPGRPLSLPAAAPSTTLSSNTSPI